MAGTHPSTRYRNASGFTLLELIIVVAIIGILATIAMPQLLRTPLKTREAVLRTNLLTLRDVIDQYYADKGHFPPTLEALVEQQYLRAIPIDPITKSNETWVLIRDDEASPESEPVDGEDQPGIIDVRSGAPGETLEGTPYSDL